MATGEENDSCVNTGSMTTLSGGGGCGAAGRVPVHWVPCQRHHHRPATSMSPGTGGASIGWTVSAFEFHAAAMLYGNTNPSASTRSNAWLQAFGGGVIPLDRPPPLTARRSQPLSLVPASRCPNRELHHLRVDEIDLYCGHVDKQYFIRHIVNSCRYDRHVRKTCRFSSVFSTYRADRSISSTY